MVTIPCLSRGFDGTRQREQRPTKTWAIIPRGNRPAREIGSPSRLSHDRIFLMTRYIACRAFLMLMAVWHRAKEKEARVVRLSVSPRHPQLAAQAGDGEARHDRGAVPAMRQSVRHPPKSGKNEKST